MISTIYNLLKSSSSSKKYRSILSRYSRFTYLLDNFLTSLRKQRKRNYLYTHVIVIRDDTNRTKFFMYAIPAGAIFLSSLDDEEVQGFTRETASRRRQASIVTRTVLQERETRGERIQAMVENVVEKLSVPTRIRLPIEREGTLCHEGDL